MSLAEVPVGDATGAAFPDTSSSPDFKFVPKYLAAKCQQLIKTYHAMNGYACLPDMLWHMRDLIEANQELRHIFRKSSTARSAKKANEGFVLIATAILSLEVLASDFAGWGRRFPWAKRKAEEFRREHLPNSLTRLMDLYLYPQRYINPAFINALAPPERPRSAEPDRMASRDPADADAKSTYLTPDELGWRAPGLPALNGV
jgi:hypothetical protein